MTSEQFTTWLKGFFELSNQDHLTKEQVEKIKLELQNVVNYINYVHPTTPYFYEHKYPDGLRNPFEVTCKE